MKQPQGYRRTQMDGILWPNRYISTRVKNPPHTAPACWSVFVPGEDRPLGSESRSALHGEGVQPSASKVIRMSVARWFVG